MGKIKYYFISFLLYSITLFAQNTMIIPNVSGNAGDTVEVSVQISNADEFVAFQLSLHLHSQLSYLSGSAVLAGRETDHTLSAGMVSGDSLRLVAYSTTGDAFTGSLGSVVTFDLILGTVPGTYDLNPQNTFIADSLSNDILTGVTDGQMTLYAPEIQLNTGSLNYTRTIVGNYRDLTFNISNNGNASLNVDSIVTSLPTAYTVQAGWSSPVFASGSEMTTVRFEPPVKGEFNGTVTVYSDDPDEPLQSVAVSGTGYKVNELHVNNLSTRSGTDTTLTFKINNQEPVTGFQFDLALPSSMTYITDSEVLTVRANGHEVDANVVSGNKLRVLAYSSSQQVFSGTDGDIVEVGFHVEGTGGSYNLNLSDVFITDSTDNVVSDFYNGQLSIAAGDIHSNSIIDYDSVSIFDTSQVALTLQNLGDDTLLIENFSANDVHFWTDVLLPLTIDPSAQTSLSTFFHSSDTGRYTGQYTVLSNDPDEYPYYISFTADAFSPNIMRTEDASGFSGDTVEVFVSIENNDPFTAFQLDIDFPSVLSVILDSTQLTDRRQDHTLTHVLISGNRYRFLSYSSTNALFSGNSGNVLRILCTISGSSGDYPLTIISPVISNASGQNILSSYANGTLTVSSDISPRRSRFKTAC